jgi:hypothetical protein
LPERADSAWPVERVYGIGLPDDVLRKMYYANALKYLPAARAKVEKQLAARR